MNVPSNDYFCLFVVQLKKCGNHITILVIDSESEKNYAKQRLPILPTFAIPSNLPYRAKKYNLVSKSDGYGFLLRLEKTPSGRTCERTKNKRSYFEFEKNKNN